MRAKCYLNEATRHPLSTQRRGHGAAVAMRSPSHFGPSLRARRRISRRRQRLSNAVMADGA